MIFCTTRQMPAKFAMATAAPTRLPPMTEASKRAQPTVCRAANTTHMAAVHSSVPPVMRASCCLDSGSSFMETPSLG